jgi:hypothetical protein
MGNFRQIKYWLLQLKGIQNSKQTLQDDGMLQQLRSTT